MIRPLEIADAEAVAAIARRARIGAIPHFPDLHSPAEDLAFYRGEIDSKPGWAWVDEPGRIVGFVIRRDAFIDHLYVDPERQRSGIGAELLGRAVAEIDGPQVRLWTFQANTRAVAFYGRNGFRILEATEGSGNEERLPDFLFVRP